MSKVVHLLLQFVFKFGIISSDQGYFWHVTDFHYDFSYDDAQLSCNPDNRPSNRGEFGDFWCDSPWSLINSSAHAMAKIKPDVDFVLWTGDTVLHGTDDELNYTINAGILDDTTNILKTTLPGVPVYASFGNHDYWPNNQFPPENNRLYNDTLARWQSWINDPSQHGNFKKGAYYTVKNKHGLRIIALNTNLYYTSNKAVANSTDPGEQLVWLNATLFQAKAAQEKVLVTAHIPPGVHTPNGLIWMHTRYHEPLLGLLRTYADIIVGMHFGHDHADGFKVLKNSQGTPSAPIFIAPSVTPWRYKIPNEIGPAHNPGVRLVKYDRLTGVHLDIEQYYLDLEKANRDKVDNWTLEYKASSHYETSRLNAEELMKLIEKMKSSNGNQFVSFWRHYTVSPPVDLQPKCDENCHVSIICGFTEFEMPGFDSCKAKMIGGTSGQHGPSFMLLFTLIISITYLVSF